METHALRRLVEQIVAEVVAEWETASTGPPEPRPLILMTGAVDGVEVVLHQLRRLRDEVGPMTAALSEGFCEFVPAETFTHDTGIEDVRLSLTRREAEALASASSLFLIGTMSANALAKMALGFADCWPSVLYESARLAGVPIFVGEPPPAQVTPSRPAESDARARQRADRLSVVRADGAQVIPATEICERVKRHLLERGDPVAAKRAREAGPRPVITVEDVERAHRRGTTSWKVPENAIVTAAAWDRARDLGMTMSGGNLP